jgi:two-component sensor histidine kinase
MATALEERSNLDVEDQRWLISLVREWHVLADTAFSDLVLWVATREPGAFWAVAQRRPNTGPTSLADDITGSDAEGATLQLVQQAFATGLLLDDPQPPVDLGIRQAIPLMRSGCAVAVLERRVSSLQSLKLGALEDNYLDAGNALIDMAWRGEYPIDPPGTPLASPRIGDGFSRIDNDGIVLFASPNAVSSFRRLGLSGNLEGQNLRQLVTSLASISVLGQGPVDEFGRRTVELDVEVATTSIRLRVIPLRLVGQRVGEMVLSVDSTAIRERERQLVTKDATIREVHHRVKNNLQTVASLLRLQARRMDSAEARDALKEAVSRVQSIAVVHEILSHSYDEMVAFDVVVDQLLLMVGDLAGITGTVNAFRKGSFGLIPADAATALSLAITELCQNAVEHGLGYNSGRVEVSAARDANRLDVTVWNDGEPLPPNFAVDPTKSLGLSIVGTLISDLGGTFALFSDPEVGGTTATISLEFAAN